MLADPLTLVETRERKTREFARPMPLQAGEVAEFRRPIRWGFLIITAIQLAVCAGVVGLVVAAFSILGA